MVHAYHISIICPSIEGRFYFLGIVNGAARDMTERVPMK